MISQSERTEELVVTQLPRFTGTLSILGSSAIILSMMTNRGEKLKSSFNRLLFMLCLFDIFPSIANVWSTSALPKLPKDDTYYGYNAAGNWTTCRVQGFLYQLGMVVPIYFYFLTVHYLLVIRYGMKEERICLRIEPFMHVFALVFAFGTSIAAWILKIFNPDTNFCWLANYPKNCADDPDVDCIYGGNSTIYLLWIFGGFPSMCPLVLVPFTMGLIFWTVRKQALKMNRYSPNSIYCAATSTTSQSFNMRQSFTISQAFNTRQSFNIRRSFCMQQSTSKDNDSFDLNMSSISNLRRKLRCKTTERLKAVAHQGLAYSFCYLLVFSWPIIMYGFLVYGEDNKAPLSIVVLNSVFYPLQGFFNYIVYVRPFVLQKLKTHPEWSVLRAMYEVTFPTRPGRRNCQKLNFCFSNRDENENTESIIVEFQSKNEADSDLDSGSDRGLSSKGLDATEEKEENDELGTVQSCAEDGNKTLNEDLTRAAVGNNKTEPGLDTEEQKIKEESAYFEAITELSKITGNCS